MTPKNTVTKDALAELLAGTPVMPHRLFANGHWPGGIIMYPHKLTSDAAKRLKASWRAATSQGAAR